MHNPLKSAKFLGVFAFTTLNQCEIDYKIMAVEVTFTDDSDSGNLMPILQIQTDKKFTAILVKYSAIDKVSQERIICLNKKSAIKLAKELRKQISFLEG